MDFKINISLLKKIEYTIEIKTLLIHKYSIIDHTMGKNSITLDRME